MHVRLITYEPGQILTLCYNVCPLAHHSVAQCCRARAAKIEKGTLIRYKVGGYASNTILPRYAIASPALSLMLERCQAAVLGPRTYISGKCYPSVTLPEL